MSENMKLLCLSNIHINLLETAEFIEGDIFYDDSSAYSKPWSEARKKITKIIQVINIKRTNIKCRSVYLRNCVNTIDLIYYDKDDNKYHKSIKAGCLLEVLKTGNLDYFNRGNELFYACYGRKLTLCEMKGFNVKKFKKIKKRELDHLVRYLKVVNNVYNFNLSESLDYISTGKEKLNSGIV